MLFRHDKETFYSLAGIVNWFLSWKLFIPLSRLTYLAYLIHPVVLEVYYQGQRDGFYLNDFNLVGQLVWLSVPLR